jgi:hypothetical protein
MIMKDGRNHNCMIMHYRRPVPAARFCRVECVRLSRTGRREGGPRCLVSLGSGQVYGQILAGLPLDTARVPPAPGHGGSGRSGE